MSERSVGGIWDACFASPGGRAHLRRMDEIFDDPEWMDARPVHCLDQLFDGSEKNSNLVKASGEL